METSILFIETEIVPPPITLPSREIGACVEFYGIVRELENEQPLKALEYSVYEPMASQQLARIFDDLSAPHPVRAIVFIHRLGVVPVGEASLFIRIFSAHRSEALAFCSAAIDRMKRHVPIWKRAVLDRVRV